MEDNKIGNIDLKNMSVEELEKILEDMGIYGIEKNGKRMALSKFPNIWEERDQQIKATTKAIHRLSGVLNSLIGE